MIHSQAKFINEKTDLSIKHKERKTYRLNKFLAETGEISRRKADEAIKNSRVYVNGKIAKIGMKVTESDKVELDAKEIKIKSEKVYLALNKPKGIVCNTDKKEAGNISNFVNYPERIFPIGRIDRDSTGLILLTNDGDLVNKLLGYKGGYEKEYHVVVDKPIRIEDINKLEKGILIHNPVKNKMQRTKPCKIERISSKKIKIILREGLNRQIRRMLSKLEYQVVSLNRVRFGNIKLSKLKQGEIRYLSEDEIRNIL